MCDVEVFTGRLRILEALEVAQGFERNTYSRDRSLEFMGDIADDIGVGGRGRDVRLMAGRTTFDVHLERDAWKRQRIIDTGYDCLNFSALPEDHNPLRDLIAAFVEAVKWDVADPDLDPSLALRAARVTEDVLSMADRCRPSVEAYAGP